ncbi:threonine dehydratase [Blastomyces gilchristii SLH14081]|uniref:Threonine dehydratase n=1 Tax=Blastomyces gilchristii (strain SLH14081) TaxID=559298 RepID=A0A179UQB7_BLAGS|nr:threonine dehydratase [Blastomyces gilchristii SLH14081]OAT09398.1 threonine dehydratase [Blastomyces gilchristii SLH14081]
MTDPTHWLPLTTSNVLAAHDLVKPYIHETPILTSKTLNRIASTPQAAEALVGTPFEGQPPAQPKINFFFKCENLQRIGAFKARGAFHALLRAVQVMGEEEVRRRGVVTHSSGNHAQALALAASTLSIPAYIVMPSISTPSKIAGTRSHGAKVIFSGSTSQEREAVVATVIAETGAILIPPYDHADVVLGQGTVAVELEKQVRELVDTDAGLSVHPKERGGGGGGGGGEGGRGRPGVLDAVITPLGGAGLTSGVATYYSTRTPKTLVFGAEPSFQGGDDCRRGLAAGERVTSVKTLTIADGLRTPVGEVGWSVVSDKEKVRGVYAVSEGQILAAMRLVLERVKVVVEPSAVVGLAVCLFDEGFRRMVVEECAREGKEGWDVGVVFSGGNTTVERIGELFMGGDKEE